ncbi:MAG: TolB family protein, partial [Candidatus Promineifilaceae bacterium]
MNKRLFVLSGLIAVLALLVAPLGQSAAPDVGAAADAQPVSQAGPGSGLKLGGGQTSLVSIASDGTQGNYDSGLSSVSADGRYVAFTSGASNLVAGDTNGLFDVFVHDRDSGQTSRVSVASDGAEGNGVSDWPSISADGRYVAFQSLASNLVGDDTNGYLDVFIHDRDSGQTSRVSVAWDGDEGNGDSWEPSISADGRYVAFH